MKKAAPALAAVLLLLLPTACGSNGDSSKSGKPTDAEKPIITSMAGAITTQGGLLDSRSATCVATRFVTSLGADKLHSAKVIGTDDKYVPNGALVDASTASAYSKAVLGCISETDALAKLTSASEAGYGASTQGVLGVEQVNCLIGRFTRATGVAGLFTSGFVTDTGTFAPANKAYDDKTAQKFADALLGCVNYQKLQAQDAIGNKKNLSLPKLTACLARKTTNADVKAIVVAQLTGSAAAAGLTTANQKKIQACAKVSKK